MIAKLRVIGKDELVRGSIVLVFMIGLFNVLNYAFQISMAKMLGPADYGILAVLMSFIYLFSIPTEAIQTAISRYVSKFNLNKEFGKIRWLIRKSTSKGGKIAGLIFLGFLPVAYVFSIILDIRFTLIALTGLFIFYVFAIPIIRGVLQGRKKFLGLGGNLVIESLVKLVFSILLVFLGLKVYGAMAGVLIGSIACFAASFGMLKEIMKSKEEKAELENVYYANLPVLAAITSLVLMYSIDIIFARAFFSPEVAGQYAFVSLIGKTILFISLAIGKAMFPLSSEGFESGRQTSGILKKSVLIVTVIAITALIFFFFLPEAIVKIISLGSDQYIGAANVLFTLGLAFSLLSISNVIINYHLAIHKKSNYFSLLIINVIQAVLLIIFHSSLQEFSRAILASNAIMFLYSIYLTKR